MRTLSVSRVQSILFTLKTSFSASIQVWASFFNLFSLQSHIFLVTATGEDKIVRNKIGQAIVERIKRAYYDGEKFKVFILIPLIPAFEGDLTSGDSAAAR